MGADAGIARHSWNAAVWGLCQRISDSYHRYAGTSLDNAISFNRARRRLRCHLPQSPANGLRGKRCPALTAFPGAGAGLHSSCNSAGAGRLHAVCFGRVVPGRGAADRRVKMATDFIEFQPAKLPANILSHRLRVDRQQWLQTTEALRESNARFLTLWGADDRDRDGGFRIYAAYLLPDTVMVVEHTIQETL